MKKIWKGKYAYSEDKDSPSFSFEITAEYDNGSFEGTAYEEEFTGATSDIVHVKGFTESNLISFVITYPYLFAMDDKDNYVIDKTQSGHEVIYEGYFNEEEGFWSGEWEIITKEKKIAPDEYETLSAYGIWKMSLSED